LTPPSTRVNTFPSIVIVAAAPLGLVLGEAETLAEGEGLVDGDVLVEADGDVLGDAEGVALTDVDGEDETDADGDSEAVPLGLLEADADGELLVDGELDGLLDADAEGLVDGDADGEALGLVLGEADGELDAEVDGLVDGDVEGDDEGLETLNGYARPAPALYNSVRSPLVRTRFQKPTSSISPSQYSGVPDAVAPIRNAATPSNTPAEWLAVSAVPALTAMPIWFAVASCQACSRYHVASDGAPKLFATTVATVPAVPADETTNSKRLLTLLYWSVYSRLFVPAAYLATAVWTVPLLSSCTHA
jgi:hypothetical protein